MIWNASWAEILAADWLRSVTAHDAHTRWITMPLGDGGSPALSLSLFLNLCWNTNSSRRLYCGKQYRGRSQRPSGGVYYSLSSSVDAWVSRINLDCTSCSRLHVSMETIRSAVHIQQRKFCVLVNFSSFIADRLLTHLNETVKVVTVVEETMS